MTNVRVLPTKSVEQAVNEAKGLIQTERSGTINGLYTRWGGINNFMMKYWRFRTVTGIGGLSGSGKSAILTMIEDDFTNPDLNPAYLKHIEDSQVVGEDRIILLAFKYEMDAADDILRNLSGKVQKSYSYLLSSYTENTGKTYNTVSDIEYQAYCDELDKLKSRPIIYIENAGNLEEMEATIAHYKEKYPKRKVIVTIDHTLLSKKLSEKDDGELSANTAHKAIKWRKTYDALVIFLCQLNGNIEDVRRRDVNQFPVKTDVHYGAQIFWACDYFIIFHRPEKLGIFKYGTLRTKEGGTFSINPHKVVHAACIKNRKNHVGNIWFKDEFHIGNIRQVRDIDIKYLFDPKAIV